MEKAKSMAALLLKLGATSAQADLNGCTVFHRYVDSGRPEMIDTLWEHDKTGVKTALNHLLMEGYTWDPQVVAPLQLAIDKGDSVLALKLLNAGAKPEIDFETWLASAKHSEKITKRLSSFEENKKLFAKTTFQPLIIALRNCEDPSVILELLKKGADANTMTPMSYDLLHNEWQRRYNSGETALDIVRERLKNLRKYKGEMPSQKKPKLIQGLDEHLDQFMEGSYQHWMVKKDVERQKTSHEQQMENYEKDACKVRVKNLKGIAEKKEAIKEAIEGLEEVERDLVERGAKTFAQLHPQIKDKRWHNANDSIDSDASDDNKPVEEKKYEYTFVFNHTRDVTDVRKAAYIQLFEAAWQGDLEKIKSWTLQSWGEDMSEPPLKIAITDGGYNTPFSLALLRGHLETAKGIAEIAEAQYAPEETEKRVYRMQSRTYRDEEYGSDEDSYDNSDDDDDSEDEPRIVSQVVGKKFTIENIGQVSMQVQSRVTAIGYITWKVNTFSMKDGEPVPKSDTYQELWNFVGCNDRFEKFAAYLDMCMHFSRKNKSADDEEAIYTLPQHVFQRLIEHGHIKELAEVIKRTGAGIPLDDLVKKSGVEVKEKPRHYQGLTVYGKKRKDWATAGRNLFVKATGLKTPPLLHAAVAGTVESVEWLLSDAPLRLYTEFAKSKAAREDSRFKHLAQGPGGFEGAVARWLGNQNDLVLHCAIMATPSEDSLKLVDYLIKTYPSALEARTVNGDTPFLTACLYGRVECVQMLVKAGVDQSVRNKRGENAAHLMVQRQPKADKLKKMMDQLDSDLVRALFTLRNNLDAGGETPLHWLVDAIGGHLGSYTREEGKEVLDLILGITQGAELEMLNGAGDSCLHAAVMKGSKWLTKHLLQFRPKLLYRENAVGRTPPEISHDRVIGDKFTSPRGITLANRQKALDSLVCQQPAAFVKEDKESDSRSASEQVWDVCCWFMERYPDKRRLVSLHEANDVAKRLGEQYNNSRYFSVQVRRQDDDDEPQDDKDVAFDFVANQTSSRNWSAWRDVKPEDKKKEEPPCPGCGHRH